MYKFWTQPFFNRHVTFYFREWVAFDWVPHHIMIVNLSSNMEYNKCNWNRKAEEKRLSEMEKLKKNPQQRWSIEKGLFVANTPAPQLWRGDESLSSNYCASNNTNINAFIFLACEVCGATNKIYSHSPPLSLVVSNITATLARGDP